MDKILVCKGWCLLHSLFDPIVLFGRGMLMYKKSGHQKPINGPPLDTVLSVASRKESVSFVGFYQVAAKYVRTSQILFQPWGVLVLLKFWVNSQKLGSSGATECGVWIGNCNVKVWKSTEHKVHKTWRSVKFQQNEHTPGRVLRRKLSQCIHVIISERRVLRDVTLNGFWTLHVARHYVKFRCPGDRRLSQLYTMYQWTYVS